MDNVYSWKQSSIVQLDLGQVEDEVKLDNLEETEEVPNFGGITKSGSFKNRSVNAFDQLAMEEEEETKLTSNEPEVDTNVIIDERTPLNLAAAGKRTLSPYGLMVMIYFWTCGGPFGIESAISAGGAGLTFVSLVVILALWCFPQALMAAELSLMMNYNGGNVVWVQRAFGNFFGFVNAVCALFMNLDNQAILTNLFIRYLPLDVETYLKWIIRIVFIGLTTLINIWSVSFISKVSWLLLVVVFTPFFAELGLLFTHNITTDLPALIEFPPFTEIKWNVLLSTIVWSFGGFDLIGFVAGEVTGGPKGFLRGVLGAFPLIFFNYSFPVVLNYIVSPDFESWGSGHFVVIAKEYFPFWMAIWMATATCTGIFGTQLNSTTTTSRLIWAMAKGNEENIAKYRYLPKFFSRSYYDKNQVLVPLTSIVTNGFLVFALSSFELEFLIQFFLILRILNLLFEYAALIYFKFKEPHYPRTFEIPGKKVGAILCVLPTLVIACLAVLTSELEALYYSAGVVALSVVLFGAKICWVCLTDPNRRKGYCITLGFRK